MDFNEFFKQCCQKIEDKNFITILEINDAQTAGNFNSLTGKEFYLSVQETLNRLSLSEIQNKKIIFLADNSVDLLVTFFAALSRGSHICILDYKLTFFETNQIINDFKPDILFTDNNKWLMAGDFDLVKTYQTRLLNIYDLKKIPLNLTGLGKITSTKTLPNHPKILVYTSGTSGTPKGVILEFSAILFEVKSLRMSFKRDFSKRKSFSILPLNHIYGLTTGVFTALWTDQEVMITQSLAPNHIRQIINERKPDYLYVVPQFLSLIKNRVVDGIKQKSFLKRNLAFLILFLNRFIKSYLLADLILGEIRKKIGVSIEFFISGGAPLSEDVFDFFEALMIPVCNGYGLSETGPVISVNNLYEKRRGSVGKVIEGVEVIINPLDQEILIRGPNVFSGYYGQNELTKNSFTSDGYFKTGDLGFLDQDGYLFVNGRSKNLIVLDSGKKIQPEEVENHFSRLSFIKNCCLIYDNRRGSLSKLILIIEAHENSELTNCSQFTEIFLSKLRKQSEALAPFKRPNEYRLRKNSFPMTSTLKIKRFQVQNEIENENKTL